MPVYSPSAIVQAADMAATYGLCLAAPIQWYIPSTQVNDESPSSIAGRYNKAKGQAQGIGRPKPQDTTLSSGKNTGRVFTSVSGTWKDDSKPKEGSNWRLLMPDASASVSFEATSDTTTSNIENAVFIVGRGVVPASVTPTASNYNAYLELAYGATSNYRIVFEWWSPIRLEYYAPETNSQWVPVGIASKLGDFNTLVKANPYVTLKIEIESKGDRNIIWVEVNNGEMIRHSPSVVNGQQRLLPTPGRLRLSGQNGWASLEYYPLRYDTVTLTKSKREFIPANKVGTLQNAGRAFVVTNATNPTAAGQTFTQSVQTDGKSLQPTITARNTDAGDGLGSSVPPTIADMSVVVPAFWVEGTGVDYSNSAFLKGMRVEELQVWDSVTRVRGSSAQITCSNKSGDYTGMAGHFALNLTASNGGAFYQRLLGVAGAGQNGIGLYRNDPTNLLFLSVSDRSYVMGAKSDALVPIGQEIVLDGWCIWSAVRFLCELGNIHPQWLIGIPLYIPPGATQDAPYGPAGDDCPYPILPRGTGLNPRLQYLPDRTPWSILLELVQDSGEYDFFSNSPAPYMMGFNNYGQFGFGPAFPGPVTPVIAYSSYDPTGVGQIEELYVYESANQMRTSLDFQGIDAQTYELLYYHLPMPAPVLQAVGFRFSWLERNARYSSPAYLQRIADWAATQASIPQQVVRFRTMFQPWVNAGDVCVVSDEKALGGTGLFVIEELQSAYGVQDVTGRSGYQDCYSWVTARNIANLL